MSTPMTIDEANSWLALHDWGDMIRLSLGDGAEARDRWLNSVNAMRRAFEPDCPGCGLRVLSKRLALRRNGAGTVLLARAICEHCQTEFYVDQNGNEVAV
ncbi:hypothetical protein [Rugamonas aquatica]|uniref:Uncharacterized protein n=1 Tax=Rugamonas aquatica TaxID=2743357 RepID=A0A6A7N641_9BURK|nr:hypothetical protein [Rugamonas aquatica]MQA40564.1 hypothetical protein [Rugamonas aquatica]